MKMAAAEGLFYTEQNASFSIFTIGNREGTEPILELRIPGLLSLMSGHDEVKGINNLRDEYNAEGFKRFDGSQTHWSTPFEGERYSVVVFCHNSCFLNLYPQCLRRARSSNGRLVPRTSMSSRSPDAWINFCMTIGATSGFMLDPGG